MPSKAGAPTVCTLDGILSSSTAPGTAFGAASVAAAAVAGARVGAAAAAGARGVTCGGATGVVAMTRISGRVVVLELPAALGFSCAAATLDAMSQARGAAHNP